MAAALVVALQPYQVPLRQVQWQGAQVD